MFVLAGCQSLDTLQHGLDTPDDLELLLEQHEYARARMLTGKYPAIDSVQIQDTIATGELNYQEDTLAEARTLASEDNLLHAVQLLTNALQKVPHSRPLHELRNTLEQQRVQQLKYNERKQLIARAQYVLDQRRLYQKQNNLETPGIKQRIEHSRNEKQAVSLSGQLFSHAQYALQEDDLDTAQTCLQLSRDLHDTADAEALAVELQTAIESRRKVVQKTTSSRQARKKKAMRQTRQQTEKLLAETRQALEKNDLHVARATFTRIPPSEVNSSRVIAIQDNLDRAVGARVEHLMSTGDTQYRADRVNEAIRTWTEARSLDPDNQDLKDRIERANKVLARLEELKRQQHK
jgi:tetratricopeptide (TPR) repeat protein